MMINRRAGKEYMIQFLFVSNLITGLTAEQSDGWGAWEAAQRTHTPLCFRKRLSWPWLLSAASTTPWRPGRRIPPGRVSGPRGLPAGSGGAGYGFGCTVSCCKWTGCGREGPSWALGGDGGGGRGHGGLLLPDPPGSCSCRRCSSLFGSRQVLSWRVGIPLNGREQARCSPCRACAYVGSVCLNDVFK